MGNFKFAVTQSQYNNRELSPLSPFTENRGAVPLLQVKNEFYRLVYISHSMGGHLSGKIWQMCLGMIET